MSKRYPGGIITNNLNITPTPEGGAPGIWTLDQALEYIKLGTWPSPTDPYFNQTTLLLHGDGTNGAQNNTFLDSSTNNFTITRNGNTTQGTFSPFSVAEGEWSNYFDGTNDYLDTDSTLKDLGTGDFCIQFWIYWNSGSIVVDTRDDNNVGWMISLPNSAPFAMRFYHNAATRVEAPIQANVWTHYAITRSSGTLRIFANGVEEDSATYTADLSDGDDFRIGARSNANSVATTLNGYLSNLSVVIGSAIYTSGFTPSTTPLSPSTTNQKLLTCYSNRFVDANTATTAKTITPTGDVSVQPFSPFAPSAAYDPSVNGGSGYFDGSGDYCTFSSNASMDFGTGNFTIQGWFYTGDKSISGGANRMIIGNSGNSYAMQLYIDSSGFLTFGNTGGTFIRNSTDLANNAWHHFAISRKGTGSNEIAMWIDGVRATQGTNNINYSSNTIYLGSFDGSQGYWNGYVSNLQIVHSSLYDSANTTITVPTAPLTAVSGTELLLNFTNAGIFDNTGKNNLETVGNAQIDTTVKKYGTGSMEFDGTGDYLVMGGGQNFVFGTGDFTIEFWMYASSFSGTNGTSPIIFDFRAANGVFPMLYIPNGTDGLRYFVDSADRITATNCISLSTWHHVALSRSGTSTKLFVDGNQVGSTYTDSNNYSVGASRPYIGKNGIVADGEFTGYIDDLRITKGVARYTANFTPPGGPFQNS